MPAAQGDRTARTLCLRRVRAKVAQPRVVPCPAAIRSTRVQAVSIEAVDGPVEILLLQGQPIGEPVAQPGPFVMNRGLSSSRPFSDYRRTQFGGWPWPSDAPCTRAGKADARHADGPVRSGSGEV